MRTASPLRNTFIVVGLTFGAAASTAPNDPQTFHHSGQVVCLAEEMKLRYKASLNPVHDHLLGFRVDDATAPGELRYYTLLKTKQSAALFDEKRLRSQTLTVDGRTFPASGVLEVSGWQPVESTPLKNVKVPQRFRHRGRLVCLAEEMKLLHKTELAPKHQHIVGFRIDDALAPGALRHYTILRTEQSEALFVDKRFQQHTLILYGRTFPASGILEVSGWQWFKKDGNLYDVYYWCETCSIRGVDPGDCACCQAPVELREKLAK